MKAVVAAFNQEKALVGAFSVITNLRMQFGCNFLKHEKLRSLGSGCLPPGYQMQFLSSQQMNVLKEQPWHRLQLEHIRPSAHVPYLATYNILTYK